MANHHELSEIDPQEAYDVPQIFALIHDGTDQTAMTLPLSSLPTQISGTEVLGWIRRLKQAANFIEHLQLQKILANCSTARHGELDGVSTS